MEPPHPIYHRLPGFSPGRTRGSANLYSFHHIADIGALAVALLFFNDKHKGGFVRGIAYLFYSIALYPGSVKNREALPRIHGFFPSASFSFRFKWKADRSVLSDPSLF